jgi:hypothetical protein
MRNKMLYVKIMVLRAKTTFVDNGRDLCIGERGDRTRIHQRVQTEETDTLWAGGEHIRGSWWRKERERSTGWE